MHRTLMKSTNRYPVSTESPYAPVLGFIVHYVSCYCFACCLKKLIDCGDGDGDGDEGKD